MYVCMFNLYIYLFIVFLMNKSIYSSFIYLNMKCILDSPLLDISTSQEGLPWSTPPSIVQWFGFRGNLNQTMVFMCKFGGFDCKCSLQSIFIVLDELLNILFFCWRFTQIFPINHSHGQLIKLWWGGRSSKVKDAQLKANSTDNGHTSQTQLRFFFREMGV